MHIRFRPLALCASVLLMATACAQLPPPPVAPGGAPPAPNGVPPAPDGVPPTPSGALPPLAGVPPVPGMAPPPANAGVDVMSPVISGRLQRWLVTPNGTVDGFLLSDGTQVNFPPHLSATLLQSARIGDTVQVSGWRTPQVPVLRATRMTVGGRTIEDTPPAVGMPPPVPPEAGALAALSASGRVERLLYAPRGEPNGVLLDNGSIVRFPPHVGMAMGASLQPGSTVFARGWGSRSAQGTALEATALGPTAETARELFAGPGVEPPVAGPRDARGPRGPRDPGPVGAAGMPPPPVGGAPAAPPVGDAPPPPRPAS
ncbi:hypothetical protein [Xylophilus sp. Leaf220]|uniref:hypothetical protein n=1 Tax=Xylophilus sp. Leaf220 TaxID=1735686 RepID=UPI0012E0F5E1|nr:hypothetical protein [Xylophilus sp. Leaf220]